MAQSSSTPGRYAPSAGSKAGLAFICLFFPMIPVYMVRGCHADLLINFLLWTFGYAPGIIHGIYIVYAKSSYLDRYPPHRPQPIDEQRSSGTYLPHEEAVPVKEAPAVHPLPLPAHHLQAYQAYEVKPPTHHTAPGAPDGLPAYAESSAGNSTAVASTPMSDAKSMWRPPPSAHS